MEADLNKEEIDSKLAELSETELLYMIAVVASLLSKPLALIGACYQLTKELDSRTPEGNTAAEFLDALSKDLKTQTEGRIQF